MTVPSARGLFQGAIAESGYGRQPFPYLAKVAHGQTPAEESGVKLMQKVGVTSDDPAVLRAVPADTFKSEVDPYGGAMIIVDGKVVPDDLWSTFRKGRELPVPFIAGSNSLETPPGPNSAGFEKRLARFVQPSERPALEVAYGGSDALSDNLSSDITFGEQARAFTLMHAMHGHVAYRYRFSVVADSVKDKYKGAMHATELPYVFNTLSAARWPMGSSDQAVADIMQSYWVAFVKSGTPNAPGLRAWEPAKGDKIIDFTAVGPKPETDPRAGALQALSKVIDDRS
jgi:para-nitrobenzyl esterase